MTETAPVQAVFTHIQVILALAEKYNDTLLELGFDDGHVGLTIENDFFVLTQEDYE